MTLGLKDSSGLNLNYHHRCIDGYKIGFLLYSALAKVKSRAWSV